MRHYDVLGRKVRLFSKIITTFTDDYGIVWHEMA